MFELLFTEGRRFRHHEECCASDEVTGWEVVDKNYLAENAAQVTRQWAGEVVAKNSRTKPSAFIFT